MSGLELLKRTWKEFQADDAGSLGAELAYYTLFAIFPLILAVIALMGFFFAAGFPAARSAQDYVLSTVQATMPGAYGVVIDTIIEVREKRGAISAWALVSLVISASAIFGQLQRALDKIYDCKPSKSGFVRMILQRVRNASMVLAVAFLLLVSMVVDALLKFLIANTGWLPGGDVFWAFVTPFVSLAVTIVLFGLLYTVVPQAEVRFREIWPGAVVGAFLWEIGKQILTWYIGRQSYQEVYGPLSGVVALMAWIYYSTQILFLGAELGATYRQMRTETLITPTRAAIGERQLAAQVAQPNGVPFEQTVFSGVGAAIVAIPAALWLLLRSLFALLTRRVYRRGA